MIRRIAACWLLAVATAAVAQAPYRPVGDHVVLEKLQVPRLAGAASLQELRAHWVSRPASVPAALAYARGAFELNRREEDPRYLGYAQIALGPWWDLPRPPPEIMLLRASLRLARREHVQAEQDLQALIDSPAPEGHAARITRAGLRLSQGNPVAALADCRAAVSHVSGLVAVTCAAAANGLGSTAPGALADLETALQGSADAPLASELWARAVAAELAQRLGRTEQARRHFEAGIRRMTTADSTDPGLLAAYADFLLEQREGRSVQALLTPYQRQDSLLLRLALAQRMLGTAGDATAEGNAQVHARRLALRFEEMRRRGDRSHLRDQAVFELDVRGNADAALQYIGQSWAYQRDPVDARLYLRAALAAGRPEAARDVLQWLENTGVKDLRLTAAIADLRRQAPSR